MIEWKASEPQGEGVVQMMKYMLTIISSGGGMKAREPPGEGAVNIDNDGVGDSIIDGGGG